MVLNQQTLNRKNDESISAYIYKFDWSNMIINVENLKKKYNDKIILNDINLTINEGEIVAILGKNGAGKSTFIKLLLGFIKSDSGNINIYDEQPGKNNNRIGYLSENITIYPYLSARDNIKVAALSANVQLDNKAIDEILRKVNLEDTEKKETKDFSLGMKRRLQLAITTMIKKVDFLILDEPTNGLDVNGLLWFKSYLSEMKENKMTVLIASHSLTDLQDYITDYIILNNGIIEKKGKWDKTSKVTDINTYEILLNHESYGEAIKFFEYKTFDFNKEDNYKLLLRTTLDYKELSKLLFENDIFPDNIGLKQVSLEELFLKVVKE